MYCECCGIKITSQNKIEGKQICRECFEIEEALKKNKLEEYFNAVDKKIDYKIKKRLERESKISDDEEDLW